MRAERVPSEELQNEPGASAIEKENEMMRTETQLKNPGGGRGGEEEEETDHCGVQGIVQRGGGCFCSEGVGLSDFDMTNLPDNLDTNMTTKKRKQRN